MGKVKLVDVGNLPAQAPRYTIGEGDIEREVARLRDACGKAREDVTALADRVEERLGRREADLIRPQALMVEDPTFIARVEELMVEKRQNVEACVAEVMDGFEKLILATDDPYLRERSVDVRDAGRRILANLLHVDGEVAVDLREPSVVVSTHLVPSLTVRLDRSMLLALATEHGGYTSHAAILARAMGIPAVTSLTGIADEVVDGETVIVNGSAGTVTVHPTRKRLQTCSHLAHDLAVHRQEAAAACAEPAVTQDGCRISVQANVGRPEEVELAAKCGAEGIGLYRTEFEYLAESSVPSEDALYQSYARAAEAFGDAGVVVRVLDIGGDKFPSSVPLAHEENPFMGMRGLRLLLERAEELMLPQLRAILRASAHGRVSVLYPMVTSVEDLVASGRLFRRAAREVGVAESSVRQGLMVEVPSCVHMLDEMLSRAAFASVGTNDLVQYVLAADRNSERMADTYDAFHPAVIRILKAISATALAADRPVSVCGEVAGDPHFVPLLLGLGYRALSVNVGSIPLVKRVIRQLSLPDCEKLAGEVLKVPTCQRVRRAAERFLHSRGGELSAKA